MADGVDHSPNTWFSNRMQVGGLYIADLIRDTLISYNHYTRVRLISRQWNASRGIHTAFCR